MNLRTLIIGILSMSIHTSACSSLAVAAVLMAPIAEAASGNELMSPAIFELSCITGPYSPASNPTVEEPAEGSGCEDTKACIQSTIQGEVQKSILIVQTSDTEILHPTPVHVYSQLLYPPSLFVSARDGPLYDQAPITSHQLLKRE